MTPTVGCPNCGFELNADAPVCGNCGQDLSSYRRWVPGRGTGFNGPSPKIILILLALGIAGGTIYAVRDEIGDVVSDARGAFDSEDSDEFEVPDIEVPDFEAPDFELPEIPDIPDISQPIEDGLDFEPTEGFAGVAPIVRSLRSGGMACGQMNIDYEDEYISTGSCQASGTHVQINVYLFPASLDSANQLLKQGPFATVHADNWWIITQNTAAREIHRILGGKLRIPR